MKWHKLKKILFSNAPLKIISLILGYSFWYIIGHAHLITISLTVPLSFHDTPKNYKITSPEEVVVKLSGKRDDLYTLNPSNLAVHINAEKLHQGKNHITINKKRLFLPKNIKLVNYEPANIAVDVEIKSSDTSDLIV